MLCRNVIFFIVISVFVVQACKMIQKLRWVGDPFEELTKIKSGLKVEYVCMYNAIHYYPTPLIAIPLTREKSTLTP